MHVPRFDVLKSARCKVTSSSPTKFLTPLYITLAFPLNHNATIVNTMDSNNPTTLEQRVYDLLLPYRTRSANNGHAADDSDADEANYTIMTR